MLTMADIFDILFWLLKSNQCMEIGLSHMEVAYEEGNEIKEEYSYINGVFDGIGYTAF